MSLYWIVGTLYYAVFKEFRFKKQPDYENQDEGISFLIPCYNEEETIEDTIRSILNLKFPLKEVIVINDGSSDNSEAVIRELQKKLDFVFVNMEQNSGKANALNEGLTYVSYNFIMGIDADTIIDDDGPFYMISAFKNDPKLAAVTGNPRIRNKSSILGKIQAIEYASMVGSIKRAQSIAGKVNTISGVFTLFRKDAILKVGKWDIDMITEDIAISWKFHLHDLKVKYEPRALCWMLVPETIGGLWKQRLRWAQGGQEVLIRDFKQVLKRKDLPFLLLLVEQAISLTWVYSVVFLLALSIVNTNFLDVGFLKYQFTIIVLSAFLLTFINTIQFTVSLLIDSRYEKMNIFTIIFLSWYPTIYWILNAMVAIIAFPKALKRKKGAYATWTSPDRGNIKR